jgi:GlpG protein
VVVFVGVNASGDADSGDGLRRWGALPAGDIWEGHWWALVTSAFVHVALWHVAFNVYWLFVLGQALEGVIGTARWLLFCVAAAFVSSAAQLAVSDDTGIGFSGVLYAFFGFMWIARPRWPRFEQVVDQNTVGMFTVWLVACFVLTYAGIWQVGNAAHLAGLAWGGLLGAAVAIPRRRVVARVGAAALLLASVGLLFYAPWSRTWLADRAYRLHERKEYRAAAPYYLRALDRGVDPTWAWHNLTDVYRALGETDKYEAALARLRALDPDAARQFEDGD